MKKKRFKIPTAHYLTHVALHYLERYAASEASLRRVLRDHLRRATLRHPELADDNERMRDLNSAIETIIATHKKNGVIDDAIYAENKITTLRRQGRSSRAIQQQLISKGVSRALAASALLENANGLDMATVDLGAALSLARRRRLGPFRPGATDPARRRKDCATLARAGFSIEVIRQVLAGDIASEDQ